MGKSAARRGTVGLAGVLFHPALMQPVGEFLLNLLQRFSVLNAVVGSQVVDGLVHQALSNFYVMDTETTNPLRQAFDGHDSIRERG